MGAAQFELSSDIYWLAGLGLGAFEQPLRAEGAETAHDPGWPRS